MDLGFPPPRPETELPGPEAQPEPLFQARAPETLFQTRAPEPVVIRIPWKEQGLRLAGMGLPYTPLSKRTTTLHWTGLPGVKEPIVKKTAAITKAQNQSPLAVAAEDELYQLLQQSQDFGLIDIFQLTSDAEPVPGTGTVSDTAIQDLTLNQKKFRGIKRHQLKYRWQVNLHQSQLFKDMVEELYLSHTKASPEQACLNILVKAEATRCFQAVACDDWCYVFLALWLEQTNSPVKHIRFMKVDYDTAPSSSDTDSEKETGEGNHFFLIATTEPFAEDAETVFKPDDLFKSPSPMLWIVDPTLNTLTHLHSPDALKKHLIRVADSYGFDNSSQPDIQCVDDVVKPETLHLDGTHERWVQEQVKRLLPFSVIVQALRDGIALKSIITRLSRLHDKQGTLTPSGICSNRLADISPSWTEVSLYCLKQITPYCLQADFCQKIRNPHIYSEIATFRTDSEDYFRAVQRLIERRLQHHSVENTLKWLERGSGKAKKTSAGSTAILSPVKIPVAPQVDSALTNTSHWQQGGVGLFDRMGIRPELYRTDNKLKALLTELLKEGISDEKLMVKFKHKIHDQNFVDMIRQQYPELKDKMFGKVLSVYILAYLVDQEQIALPEQNRELLQLTPIRELIILDKSSSRYQKKLKQYLQECREDNKHREQIAQSLSELTEYPHQVIDLPSYIAAGKNWLDKGVIEQVFHEELGVSDYPGWDTEQVKARIGELVHSMSTQGTGIHLKKDFTQLPQFTAKVMEIMGGFDPKFNFNTLRQGKTYAIRCLVRQLGIDIPESLRHEYRFEKMDRMYCTTQGSEQWNRYFLELVKKQLVAGTTLGEIAYRLKNLAYLDNILRNAGFSLELKDNQDKNIPWTYDSLKDCLGRLGMNVEEVMFQSQYSESATALKVEQTIRQLQRNISVEESLTISVALLEKHRSSTLGQISLLHGLSVAKSKVFQKTWRRLLESLPADQQAVIHNCPLHPQLDDSATVRRKGKRPAQSAGQPSGKRTK